MSSVEQRCLLHPAVTWDNRGSSKAAQQHQPLRISSVDPQSKLKLVPTQKQRYETRNGELRAAIEFVKALKECSRRRDLEGGKKLHLDVVANGLHTRPAVAAALIRMYGKCRSMPLAQQVFDGMIHRNASAWTFLIVGYVENGYSSVALDLFSRLDCEPDCFTYAAALKACGGLAGEKGPGKRFCLSKGMAIHRQVQERGLESRIVMSNSLVDMYSKCGNMDCAREVFNRMAFKDVVTWTSLILGYVQNGQSRVALDLFFTMDCEADQVTYIAAVKACGSLAIEDESQKQLCLEKGIVIHNRIIGQGLDFDTVLANALMNMYSKCGSMQHALQVFEKKTFKDVVTWNTLIQGYVQDGQGWVALNLFWRMDCEPDGVTYVAVLKACASLASDIDSDRGSCLEEGIAIHKQIRERGFDSDIFVISSLVDMYSKCGNVELAREVFDRTRGFKDTVTWNTLIRGYVENGDYLVAMDLFSSMDCEPNSFTYVSLLKACAGLASQEGTERHLYLKYGIAIHKQVKDRGLDSVPFVVTGLVDMYSKCGSMDNARDVVDRMVQKNAIVWSTLMLGYVQNGQYLVAMDLLSSMDCKPDNNSYVAALKACGGLASENESFRGFCLEKGIAIHKQLVQRGFDSQNFVASSLVDMYSKCGNLDGAREVFDKMLLKNVVTWNALIQAYVKKGECLLALNLYAAMDCEPDRVTYIAVLEACGRLVALPAGQQIHASICRLGLEQDEGVINTLVKFYGSCGTMRRAEELFLNRHSPDIGPWSALLAGYSSLGESREAFRLVNKMLEAGLQIDAVTFSCLLTVCNYAGLVVEGKLLFESMATYGVVPTVEHYNSMVDMLGRHNRLQEALALIRSMPLQADIVTWTSLLGACRTWKNVQVGQVAFDALVALDVGNAAAYAMMLDIYASLNMRKEVEALRKKAGQIERKHESSLWCDSEGVIFEFVEGDEVPEILQLLLR